MKLKDYNHAMLRLCLHPMETPKNICTKIFIVATEMNELWFVHMIG
jgi:hypothetical protein